MTVCGLHGGTVENEEDQQQAESAFHGRIVHKFLVKSSSAKRKWAADQRRSTRICVDYLIDISVRR